MGCQAGAAKVHAEILGHWPDEAYNAGCFNPESVLDDGVTPSPHARGEAIDVGIHPPYRGDGGRGETIFRWLHANRQRLGIVQLIYNRRIWSATNQPGAIRPYNVNPHEDHIHVQFTAAAARNPTLTALPFDSQSPLIPTPRRKLMFLVKDPRNTNVYITDGLLKRKLGSDDEMAKYQFRLKLADLPIDVEQTFTPEYIDAIPDAT